MAKANDTAIEQLYKALHNTHPSQWNDLLLHDKDRLLSTEREQIEAAYRTGRKKYYIDETHYFFMEYIDND